MAIRSFKGRRGEILLGGDRPRDFPPDLVSAAKRKLRAIQAAEALGDLAQVPGNRLETEGRQGRPMVHPHQRPVACLFRVAG
jgi:plasmid maintenance system killer protein